MLSKSDYMLFLRHPAWLWLKKHDPEKLPPIDAATQALFDAGHLFESIADRRFPTAIMLGFSNYNEYLALPDRTRDALKGGSTPVLQGRFEYGELTCICDVISVVDGPVVDLIEIKGSTKAKEEHEFDLAYQKAVLEGCGYTVRTCTVMHVNSACVRSGDIEPMEITAETDVTAAVAHRKESTARHIGRALATLHSSTCPDLSPSCARLGSLHEWIPIYQNLVPLPEFSIYDLCQLKADQVKLLETAGILELKDIPETIDLNPRQREQVTATKDDLPHINREALARFLDTFRFPLYFLDYETLASVIPRFDGMKPYQQYPFQYSLHVLDRPDGKLRHLEYLHRENTDPTTPLTAQLMHDIGEVGSVVTWNMRFEKGCNERMAMLEPAFDTFSITLNERIVDLMEPFTQNWYVDKHFYGSASIKRVLPVLVPSLSYAELEIHEGASAQRLWMEAVLDGKHHDTVGAILSHLLVYCQLDTLAMVEIYRFLTSLS